MPLSPLQPKSIDQLQQLIGYDFDCPSLLGQALTHKSSLRLSRIDQVQNHNERLEFLGDSVLSLVVSHQLFIDLESCDEGVLSRERAYYVSSESLAELADRLCLVDYMILGPGFDRNACSGERAVSASVREATIEAIFGAIYLDGGIPAAQQVILRLLYERTHRSSKMIGARDAKSQVQELLQANKVSDFGYVKRLESGPDHDKVFIVALVVDEIELSRGEGRSLKKAEQRAASIALSLLRERFAAK